MNYGLDTFARAFYFWVLVGATDVRIENNLVTGRWVSKHNEWKGDGKGRTLTEQFLNTPAESNEVLRFTRRFGPLKAYFGVEEPFHFNIEEWQLDQRSLSAMWDRTHPEGKDASSQIIILAGFPEAFRYTARRLSYKCANLFRFMQLEILASPNKRRRVCLRAQCGQRFLAKDLREKYCSSACAESAKRQAKLVYWNSKKKEYLEQRKTARLKRSQTNVSRKTR